MKEDLIRLKSSFDTNERYCQYGGGAGILCDKISIEQILLSNDSVEAVSSAEELLRVAICNLSSNDVLYDELVISPFFSIFVDERALDENGEIIDYENGIIKDYVGVTFLPVMAYNDGISIDVDKMIKEKRASYDEKKLTYYTRFSDFIIKLNEFGYELSGISNFNDICNRICHDESAVGDICISFKNEKQSYK